jgi:hypothetical protein
MAKSSRAAIWERIRRAPLFPEETMTLDPPRADQRPHSFEHHGIRIEDPYHWIRDPGYPDVTDEEVLGYLKAENAYFDAAMAPHQPLIDQLFQEMKGRMKEDDRSVPTRNGDWLYWWAFEEGAQYRRWYRKPAKGGGERLIFDEAAEAEGRQYFRLGAIAISDDGRFAATMVDDEGSERFKLRIRDLQSGEDVETVTEVGIGGRFTDIDLHRSQRELAELPRAPSRHGTCFGDGRHRLRRNGRARLQRRRDAVTGPQPHLHLDGRP